MGKDSPKKSNFSFSQKRSKLRTLTKSLVPSPYHLQKSLQTIPVEGNVLKLQTLKASTSSDVLKKKLDALIHILEILCVPASTNEFDNEDYESSHKFPALGFIEFDVGLDLYADFIEAPLDVRHDDISTRFRDDILDPVHGIRCIIYGTSAKRLIILDSDHLDLFGIFQHIILNQYYDRSNVSSVLPDSIDYHFIQQALYSMDSEHDKNVVKSILSRFLTRDQIYSLGIKPDNALKHSKRLTTIFEEIENATVAAEDMITLRLKSKIDKAEDSIKHVNEQLNKHSDTLPQIRKLDLCAKRDILMQNIEANKDLLNKTDKISKQKFKQCVKRLSQRLIKDNRIKLRKSGAGAKSLLDSEDETFIANAIESKTSAHGRRHDTVMYLNHRVKSEDLLSIANYSLMRRGKKLIKSAKTVQLRARPRNINTIEGKKHKGHWLFCAKKPPKTEDDENILTHHQRAHVKLNRIDMFGRNSSLRENSMEISFDDKAYIRPGTDVGFRDTKAGKILQVSDETKQRKLPQHDFGTPEVYQTPSSFRFMTWRTEEINGEDKLIKNTDESHVIIRPKYYVGSSGCVWASDLMRLRYECPDVYEVATVGNDSKQLRRLCAIARDSTFHFVDSTTDEDIKSVVEGDAIFTRYEETRISNFGKRLQLVKTELENHEFNVPDIFDKVCKVVQSLSNVKNVLLQGEMNVFKTDMKELLDLSGELIKSIDSKNLPPVKSIISEYTDAGPGVGINNTAVRFRFAEMARIHNTTRRIRIHRASGDSAQNEAERTNSAIGDALVDGSTLSWDIFSAFDGLTDDEIHGLTSTEIDKLKANSLERNAWAVAEQVKLRVDESKGPSGGFLHAYVTELPDDQFFWNGTYLKNYCDASKASKSQVPGHGYFSKIFTFIDSHIETGELYMEYRKHLCRLSANGEACNFCDLWQDENACIKTVPRPYPDKDKLPNFHYLSHSLTPLEIGGSLRPVDDFQPRANLKQLFSSGEISSLNQDSISAFSTKYIVSEEMVYRYVKHLETLKFEKEKRLLAAQEKRQGIANKTYDEIDWNDMFENNTLEKQTVATLDKYISHHSLGSFHYKTEKVQAIKRHIATYLAIGIDQSEENDIVLAACDTSSEESSNESSDESDSDDNESEHILTPTSDDGIDDVPSSSESDTKNVPVFPASRRRAVKVPDKFKDYFM